jgi:predicted DCC family thiol-disulfide oxidoreductase YuxK
LPVKNGWTGGQYSLFRAVFGGYLLIHFSALLPYGSELFSRTGVLPDRMASPLIHLFPNILAISDAPAAVLALLAIAAVASIAFAAGFHDRIAAVVVWYASACLFGRNPLIANPSLPFVGWILLAHACLPRAPYGSWDARGRIDPRGGWSFPPSIFGAAWIVMAVGYTYSGWTKLVSASWVDGTAIARVLANPLARPTVLREAMLALPAPLLHVMTWGALALELLFAPLALFRRVRPVLWSLMLLMHLGLMTLIDFADLSVGMIVLHLFTFDPRWIPSVAADSVDDVFYDGSCGLCHRAIRFLIAEDASGTTFRYAPLGGDAFAALVGDVKGLPDSVVVRTPDGAVLTKSDAALRMLSRLGGLWRVAAIVGGLVPRSIRNVVYDFIARIRYKLFARPKEACPLLPPDLRARFSA